MGFEDERAIGRADEAAAAFPVTGQDLGINQPVMMAGGGDINRIEILLRKLR
jgi:hypothetical protein